MIWPVILVPKELLSSQAYRRKQSLYLLYGLYVTTNVALGTVGWLLGTQVSGLQTILSQVTSWTILGHNIFANVVVNLIVLTAIGLLSRLFSILWRGWKRRVEDARSQTRNVETVRA